MLHLYLKDIRLLIAKVQVFRSSGGMCLVFSLPLFLLLLLLVAGSQLKNSLLSPFSYPLLQPQFKNLKTNHINTHRQFSNLIFITISWAWSLWHVCYDLSKREKMWHKFVLNYSHCFIYLTLKIYRAKKIFDSQNLFGDVTYTSNSDYCFFRL